MIITFVISFIVLFLCVFVAVHATWEIKNNPDLIPESDIVEKQKFVKMSKILIFSILIFIVFYAKTVIHFENYKMGKNEETNYKKTVIELNEALLLEVAIFGKSTYKTPEDIALSLEYRLPTKDVYYLKTRDKEATGFNDDDIQKYRLNEFVNRPTILTLDGMLLSVIKAQNGCKYIDSKYIGKSDCIIEVDVNNFKEPNQIGQDRVLMAIDGVHNSIKTDNNFFK